MSVKIAHRLGGACNLFTVEALRNGATRLKSIQQINLTLTAKMGTVQNRAFVGTLSTGYISAALRCRELSHYSWSLLHEAQLIRRSEALKKQFEQNKRAVGQEGAKQVDRTNKVAGQIQEAMRIATAQKEELAKESSSLHQEQQKEAVQQRKQKALQDRYVLAKKELDTIELEQGEVTTGIGEAKKRVDTNNKILFGLKAAVALTGLAAAVLLYARGAFSSSAKAVTK